MELVWHAQALLDRQAIYKELAQQAENIAQEWDKELDIKLAHAMSHPAALPAGRVQGTLELVLLPHYVVVLQQPTTDEPIVALRLLHISKPWPERF